jgi:hypothetical protein
LNDPNPTYKPPKFTAQLSLRQLFAVTTAVAVATAAGQQWIRALAFDQLGYAGLAAILMVVAYLWINHWSAAVYQRTIREIGQPLGEVLYRPLLSRFLRIGALSVVVLVSLALVGAAISIGSLQPEQRLVNLAQGSIMAGICLAVIRKRLALKPLLIYGDRGLSDGDHAYPWSAATIRVGQSRKTVTLRRFPLTETLPVDGDIEPLRRAKERSTALHHSAAQPSRSSSQSLGAD